MHWISNALLKNTYLFYEGGYLMRKHGSTIIMCIVVVIFSISMFIPIQASAQFFPPLFPPPPLFAAPSSFIPSPVLFPPPIVPSRIAATTTVVLALPSPAVVPAALPVAPAPLISTTQLFLGLLLRIGEESGLFATNPALFWYIVGILY